MFDLSGKTALVTGAGGAIGSAICSALSSRGAVLAATGRDEAKLKSAIERLPGENEIIVADLATGAEALAKRALEVLGKVDILVHNAGVTRDKLMVMMDEASFDEVIDVDLKAIFLLTKALLRPMMKARAGRIISIGSVVGSVGNAGQTNYAAAKSGLVGMTKSLARELAPRNITCNVVAPGFIESDMTAVLTDVQKEAVLKSIPLGFVGSPKDVASAVCYLACDEARYVTGTVLHVNGGMAMP